jgi:hypothetical protein
MYLLGDRLLYRDQARNERKVTGFVQLGWGDDRVGPLWGLRRCRDHGHGVIRGSRPQTSSVLGVAYARNGSHYMSAQRTQGTLRPGPRRRSS